MTANSQMLFRCNKTLLKERNFPMTTETKEQTKSAIKPEVQAVADSITKAFQLDESSGIVTTEVRPLSVASEQTGATKEMFDIVKKTESIAMAGTTLAIGTIGVEAMEKNANLNHVQATVPMHGDETYSTGINRVTETRNVKTGEPMEVWGQTHTRFATTSSANKGQMSKVRQHLKDVASAALNKG